MLGLNYLLTIVISVTLAVNEVTSTVGYIYRRDNSGLAKVLQIGANHAQFASQRLKQQWNPNGFETHNFRNKVSYGGKPIIKEANTDKPNSAKVNVIEYHQFHPQPLKPTLEEAQVITNAKITNKQYENQNAARNNQFGLHPRQFALRIAQPSPKKLIKLQSTYQKPNKAHIVIKPVYENSGKEDGKDIEQSLKKHVEVKDLVISEYGGDIKRKTQSVNEEVGTDDNDKENPRHNDKKLYDGNKGLLRKKMSKSGKSDRNLYDRHESHKNYNVDERDPRDKTKDKDTKEKEYNYQKKYSERPSSFGAKHYSDYNKKIPYYKKAGDYYNSNDDYDYDKTGIKENLSKYNIAKGDFGYGKKDFGLFFNKNGDENKNWNKFDKYDKKEELGSKKDGKQSKSHAKKGKKKFYVVKQYSTGYHNKWNKDEYKKDHDFYDDADKSGYTKNGGSEQAHHGYKKGGHSHEEEGASASDNDHYGSANADKEQDINNASDHRYSSRKGDEKEYKDNNKFSRKKGDSHEKEYAYDEEEDKE